MAELSPQALSILTGTLERLEADDGIEWDQGYWYGFRNRLSARFYEGSSVRGLRRMLSRWHASELCDTTMCCAGHIVSEAIHQGIDVSDSMAVSEAAAELVEMPPEAQGVFEPGVSEEYVLSELRRTVQNKSWDS